MERRTFLKLGSIALLASSFGVASLIPTGTTKELPERNMTAWERERARQLREYRRKMERQMFWGINIHHANANVNIDKWQTGYRVI
jgi:hypothetical protein